MPPLERADRVHGEAHALPHLEIAYPDRRASGEPFGRGETGREWSHVLGALLQRIARRDEPPYFVEVERAHGGEADMPVPLVGRVEGTAEKTDAGHGGQLAWARERA